jgi:serine/threonine-protein kinase
MALSTPMATLEERARRRVGAVLGGKYALERVLGMGGMAAVYLAVHRNGNRAAVKVLHPDLSADPGTVARFRREGYVANSLGHPGAVRVLDDDVDEDGSAYLVMELLEGENLRTRAKRLGGFLPPREVLSLGRDLCDVLAAAHERGVVHRDVKPENLFLTVERVLKVLDFGIARGADLGSGLATLPGAALGTPAFMPPEQALGHSRDVDARSDVWSAGATMFALLSGQIVHVATTGTELLVAAATRPARSLADAAPSLRAPLVALVDRALRFSRDERWPSALALRDAIDEAHLSAFGERVSRSAVGPVVCAAPPPPKPIAEIFFAETRQATVPTLSPVSTGASTAAAPIRVAPSADETIVSGQSPSARTLGGTTGLSSRESAPTLPATDPPISPGATTERVTTGGDGDGRSSGDAPRPARSIDPPPPRDPPARPAPAEPEGRGGRVLAVALALVAGVALVVSRVRSAPGEEALPHAGEAPCLVDADCAGGAGWACGPVGRCVERRGCADSRSCVAEAGGRPAVCRASDRVCVRLESQDCKVLADPGDLGNDATLWMGAMFPLSGPDAALYGEASRDCVDLARRDFAETVQGLPPVAPGGPRRPLAVVMCDDAVDPARAAGHLADDLRVPVILGFSRSKEVADLAASHFNPRGVLALAANTAAVLRTIPREPGGARLVWRTTIATDMRVAPTAALVSDVIEPALRAAPGLLAPGEPIRVALARVGNASGLSAADDYVRMLRYNGKSVAENGDSFRQIAYADSADEKGAREAAAQLAAELVRYRPHVILGGEEPGLIPAVEAAWPAGERFRPRYLSVDLPGDEMEAFFRAKPEARSRVFRVDAHSSAPAIAKFVLRHNEVFPKKITSADGHPPAYDAFYTAAYAAAALGGEPITGPALARAIPRLLPPGEPVDVGPGGIFAALAALSAGRNVDLAGAMTSLDFDPETGDASADFAVYCVGVGREGRPELVESGLVFRARTKKLEGKLHCP